MSDADIILAFWLAILMALLTDDGTIDAADIRIHAEISNGSDNEIYIGARGGDPLEVEVDPDP